MQPLRHTRHVLSPARCAVLLAVVAGCAASTSGGPTGGTGASAAGGGGTGGTAGAAGNGGAAGSGGGDVTNQVPCSPGMPCDPGATCVNGLCASGCNTSADCDAGQYCDLTGGQICLDNTLTACPAMPCAPTQVCVEGLCGTVPTGMSCGPSPFGGDGCMDNELCLSNVVVDGTLQANPVCYVLPPCSAGHPCTPGGNGALCSAGFITGKDDMCIPGGCATDQDCPASWKCIPGAMMAAYGQCTNGASGQPCGKTADCNAGLQCYTPVLDQLGTCK
jgi:hypothetical protein